MALKGKPREMNKWREVLLDPNVHFPGESSEYRRRRNELLEAEAELRRLNEAGRHPAPGTPSGRPHQGGLRSGRLLENNLPRHGPQRPDCVAGVGGLEVRRETGKE